MTRNPTNGIHDRAAAELVPLVASLANRIETERVLPPELCAALHRARMFHMLVPEDVGGEQVDVITFFHAIEALASADASTAWCVGQANGIATAAAYLEPSVAHEVFGAATSVASGPNSRVARAVKAPGGYRVTGKWNFASGSRHSQFLGAHCTVCEADGTPAKSADGRPVDRTMLFPKSQARVTDNWQVMGLKGTGSDSYALEDLFVPEAFSYTRDADADRRVHAPLYTHFTGFNMFGLSFSAVALGIAKSCIAEFIKLAVEKSPQASGFAWVLRDNAVVQSKVAQAQALWHAARALVIDIYGELWDKAVAGRPFDLDDRARMRMASTFAMNEACKVVDVIYHAAGATAIFEANPFERRFRDINCASQQGQAAQSNYEVVGQVLLGITPKGRV